MLLAALGVAAPASARVVLVATGMPELRVRRRAHERGRGAPRAARAGRAVAISRDGERGFVAAGIGASSPSTSTRAPRLARAPLGPPEITDIELAPVGTTLYVVRGRRILALDPLTLVTRYAVALNGDGTRIAIDRERGQLAAVVLANGRVAMVSLSRNALLRHVKVPGAIGVAIDARRAHARHRARAAADDRAGPAPAAQARA